MIKNKYKNKIIYYYQTWFTVNISPQYNTVQLITIFTYKSHEFLRHTIMLYS